jgi:heat shock protein HslJ
MRALNAQKFICSASIILLTISVSCTSTLYVAPRKAQCTSGEQQKCFLIRKKPTGNWILHDGEIADLAYEPGFNYKIKVKKESTRRASGASYSYQVMEVLEKWDAMDDLVPEDLMAKEWNLEYFKFEGTQYGIEENVPTLVFSKDGKVNGHAGCNRFFGNYEIDGRTIQCGTLGATRMFCEDSMDLEGAYLKALARELRALFDDNKLVLTGDDGCQMVFNYK